MSFRVTGLSPEPFRHLFGLADEELARHGVRRYRADAKPGFPDRVEISDAEPGETLLLVNHVHQPADTPYRSRHAIFVNEAATQTRRTVDELPGCLAVRPTIALRAYDAGHMMLDAAVVSGAELEPLILRMLANPDVDYLHAHYAGRGCFAARVDRG